MAGEALHPVLDREFLDAHHAYAGSSAVIAAMDHFLGELDRRLEALSHMHDLHAAAAIAHELAGAAGTLGLTALAHHCRDLERSLAEDMPELPVALARLRTRAAEAATSLHAHRARIVADDMS